MRASLIESAELLLRRSHITAVVVAGLGGLAAFALVQLVSSLGQLGALGARLPTPVPAPAPAHEAGAATPQHGASAPLTLDTLRELVPVEPTFAPDAAGTTSVPREPPAPYVSSPAAGANAPQRDGDEHIRSWLAADPLFRRAVEELLNDPDAQVREEGRQLLRELGAELPDDR